MAGAAELRVRIEGIRETKKITDAMYMIASAKMRRALRDLEGSTPYFEALKESIAALLRSFPQTRNRYIDTPEGDDGAGRNHGILLITSDRGLAGAYNHEAIRACLKCAERYDRATVFIIGEYGRQYFLSHGLDFDRSFHHAAARPGMAEAQHICAELLERYDSADLDGVSIIYTDFTANRPTVVRTVTLLPLQKATLLEGGGDAPPEEKEFLPDPETVLDGVIPSYLSGFIYGSLTESFCSEQQSRMNAMKSAGSNADKMLKELSIRYNKLRQAAITAEITEISAGARAQQRDE